MPVSPSPSIVEAAVFWLDAERWRFWVVAGVGTLVWAGSLVAERSRESATSASRLPRRPAWKLWALATLFLMVAWRWPYLTGYPIPNPDEAQILAGAITLKSYPLFWKYVDGTTHGPVTDLPLLIGHFLGLPLNYAGAHFMSGVLVLGGLIVAGRGLMLLYPPRAVRIGLAPVMLLWSATSFFDFTGYTSEQTSIFLLLASVWPILAGVRHDHLPTGARARRLALGGFLLGCIPYAKLQGSPPGAAVGLLAVVTLAFQSSSCKRTKVPLVSVLVSAALSPSLIVGAYLWIWGLGGQFWMSYITSNLLYAQAGWVGWSEMILQCWEFLKSVPGLHAVVIITIAWFAAALVLHLCLHQPPRWPWLPAKPLRWGLRLPAVPLWRRAVWLSAAIVLISSGYASLAPQRFFHHYLQYIAAALGLVGAVVCGELWMLLSNSPALRRLIPAAFILIAGLVPWSIAYNQPNYPDAFGLMTRTQGEWRRPAAIALAALCRPGDTLSVWGWMPYFFVETGLPQATREAHTYHQIEGGPLRDFYRQRFLFDFRRSSPRLFVDAVGGSNFGYGDDRPECRHESFPELAAIIRRDYIMVGEVEGSRLFVRRE